MIASKRFLIYILLLSIIIVSSCEEENLPPNCSLINPVEGEEYNQGDEIQIKVDASDPDGSVEEIDFFVNGFKLDRNPFKPSENTWYTEDTEAGEHVIKVTVKDDQNLQVSEQVTIMLIDKSPIAQFTVSDTIIGSGFSLKFNDESANNPSEWRWDFGDGNYSDEKDPRHTYDNEGVYSVMLTASNQFGTSVAVKEDYIIVYTPGPEPVADFEVSKRLITINESIEFTDLSENSPMNWHWDFGDGITSTDQNPEHSYSDYGVYVVTLCVSSYNGEDTDAEQIVVVEKGSISDIEGNYYGTVRIGDQWWMSENLYVTKYHDGTLITNETDNDNWIRLSTGAYCWYNNDIDYKDISGALYNWFAVQTEKLCPAGWHVPTDGEWKVLETYIGMSPAELNDFGYRGKDEWLANKLKSLDGWTLSYGMTNETGFSAIAGGARSSVNGEFFGIEDDASWWTSTPYYNDAIYREIQGGWLGRGDPDRNYGLSIRCIKD